MHDDHHKEADTVASPHDAAARRWFLRTSFGMVAGTVFTSLVGCQNQPTAQNVASPPGTAAPTPNPKAAFDAGTGRWLRNRNPHLEESPLHAIRDVYTPNDLFFVRDHFTDAKIDAATWRLRVHGAVKQELSLSVDDLKRMPATTLPVVVECAGNMRVNFQPKTEGTQWGNGAVSNGEWTGVPLKLLLEQAGLKPEAIEIVCEGGDSGKVIRELPVEKALAPETLVAYQLNGADIPVSNGYPLRLIVPGWVGVAQIKWLARLEARTTPFDSYYNTRHYVLTVPGKPKESYNINRIKSVIIRPVTGAPIKAGPLLIEGLAWSGSGTITRVEVSVDGNKTWTDAQLLEPRQRWGWTRWQYQIAQPPSGALTLSSRATDDAGNTQPPSVAWNRYGYGYNAIQTVTFTIS
jgi:DMSO/TMAO reductase YedYZ molybdopterin-dependent catalytic subunit